MMGHYLLNHIQNHVQCLHTQKPGTRGILEYPELFHNCIQKHIQNPAIFTKIYNTQNFDIFKTQYIFRALSESIDKKLSSRLADFDR